MTGQSDTVVIALAVIGLIGTLGTAILTSVVAILTRQNLIANQNNGAELRRNTEATVETKALVNGMTEQLRTAETGQARAEGVIAGVTGERDRGDAAAASSAIASSTAATAENTAKIAENTAPSPIDMAGPEA